MELEWEFLPDPEYSSDTSYLESVDFHVVEPAASIGSRWQERIHNVS